MTSGTKARLAGYTSLAATGLMAEPAAAGVITSQSQGFVPVTIAPGQSVNIDFGNGVGTAFRFWEAFFSSNFTYSGIPYNFTNNSVVMQTGGQASNQSFVFNGGNDVLRLSAGYLISAGKPFLALVPSGGNTANDIAGASAGEWNGPDNQTVTGYIGVRFSSPALSPGLHYGWFEVSYDNAPSYRLGSLTILSWAYSDLTDVAMLAGGGEFAPAAVPEPGSMTLCGLGLLACGAAGLRRLRAARAEATPAA